MPHIFCFGMPEAQVVRFFPWGALAINGEVTCDPPAKPGELRQHGKPRLQHDEQEQLDQVLYAYIYIYICYALRIIYIYCIY